jgi:hypothetical protein
LAALFFVETVEDTFDLTKFDPETMKKIMEY